MCEMVSTVETPDRIYFLTGEQVYRTERGRLLREHCRSPDDLPGHGAIRWYYGLAEDTGKDKEYTDFTSPANFPEEIAEAIKSGAMRGMGVVAGLLSHSALVEYQRARLQAWAEYERIEQPAWAEYERIEQPALAEYKRARQQAEAEYQRIEQPAWADYQRIKQQALAEYKRIVQPALAEYERINQPALAEYERIRQQALAEYKRINQPALAEYERIRQQVFWDLFSVPENRAEAWR